MQCIDPTEVGLCPQRLDRIRPWMRGWVDSGRLPCAVTAIMRRDRLAWFETYGLRDVEAGLPVEADSLFRFYSMTKPITSVAALMLYEEGCFALDDPIHRYIPAFAGTRVFAGGSVDDYRTEAPERGITVRDLMTHTSGLTYGFQNATVVDALYRANKVDFNTNRAPLAEMADRAAAMPLLFHPGTRWNYGVSTDVLGRLVEVWSGTTLDRFFANRIFGPLGMTDTAFHVAPEKLDRFAANYTPGDDGGLRRIDGVHDSHFAKPAVTFSGGGGLVSTAADYLRFARMIARRGELDGQRLLGRKTVELMIANHLPGDLADMGQPTFSEMPFTGIGFGLAGAVLLDPAKAQILGSAGEFSWGGMASTAFWIDPAEDLIGVFLTQLTPSSTYALRRELRVLAYQAIVD